MENGMQNGARSDHDRELITNGVREGASEPQETSGKGKGLALQNTSGSMVNGALGEATGPQPGAQRAQSNPNRMNDLPDDINHITQGFIPLSTILIRLAQATHDDLQKAIVDSANIKWMPAAINGGTANGNDALDDNSEGNRKRKTTLLKFAQDAHTKWVKALVITDWSWKADAVSKLIDLKAHLDGKRMIFDYTQNELIGLKRDLGHARLPRPDLKTALQVLTTGEASWIPEPGYILPPPLTPEEQLKWIEELNTLLSLRLNLEDYDKIPHHFKDYSIQSGRVTFKVKGEFEVDLTIADDDFEKQFWFIDFRFAFSPAPTKLDDRLMNSLEARVNEILASEGLQSCYSFLHDYVLTHKINELRRQANELVRTSWTGNLKVEPLNRALAIQYWTNRYGPNAPKSWVMVAVHSGRQKKGVPDPKHPSRLIAKWYRDNKEIQDVELQLNADELSAEGLLKVAIARHVEHILKSIHDKLAVAPRFVKKEASMRLRISRNEPLDSSLEMQIGPKKKTTLVIEPVTGFAAVRPHTRYALQGESRLNHGGKDPAEDGATSLENIRWGYVIEEFNRRGKSAGWHMTKSPIGGEEIKKLIRTREQYQPVFFQRLGLGEEWFVMMSLSLGGDEWWLVEVNREGDQRTLDTWLRLPLTKGQPDLDDGFWSHLTVVAAAMITMNTEVGQLHSRGINYEYLVGSQLSQKVRIPRVMCRLGKLLTGGRAGDKGPTWAEDQVEIRFKGLKRGELSTPRDDNGHVLSTTCYAIVKVRDQTKFKDLPYRVDRDVTFDRRHGSFTFQVRGLVGRPVLERLATHIRSVDLLASFLDAVRNSRGALKAVETGLHRVKFEYNDITLPGQSGEPQRLSATLDLANTTLRPVLNHGNPHLRVLDYLTRLASSVGGLKLMLWYMAEILPVLKAFDEIESRWTGLDTEGKGHLSILPRSADWYCIRYVLTDSEGAMRNLELDIRNRTREAKVFWFVSRRQRATGDGLDTVLQTVFNHRGTDWQGFCSGAAALQGTPGILHLLLTLDEALRAHARGEDIAGIEATLKASATSLQIVEGSNAMPIPTPQQGQHQRPKQTARSPLGQKQNSSGGKGGTKDVPLVLD